MPRAPIQHKQTSIGRSHTAEMKKKRVNLMAHQRQKKRQYRTSSPIWRAIRADHLATNPLCVHCKDDGLIRTATHVDHIDGNSWNNEPDNLQGLCHSCHSIKTAKYDHGFGNPKK